jgi:hypothetical protein
MSDEDKRSGFSFTLPGIYLGWFGVFVLFAAFTGHCNACGFGFERDYLGDMLDREDVSDE